MNETINNIITRKSANHFNGEHITKEEMELIVAAGLNAPSGMNAQESILIVIQNDEIVTKLSKLNANVAKEMLSKINPEAAQNFPADPFYGAKDVVAVLAKKTATYLQDGSLVMGNMLNAAWSMGIDSRWIHRGKEVFETEEGINILQSLNITDDVEGIGFCILGHADVEKEKTEIKSDRVFYI